MEKWTALSGVLSAGKRAEMQHAAKGGRKPALDSKAMKQVRALMADRSTRPSDISAQYKIRKSALYKLVREGQMEATA